ncbi:hypothetical protein HJ127_05530 [Vibrio parahaemolyticus]|nr:hypothetical protein [Vibrio parahaemolyticus]
MSRKSQILEELESLIKIDYAYYEELIKCGVSENEAWLRAMSKYFLEIDGSFESIHIIRDVIYDEYCLKDRKEHSRHFETHGEYLLENVEKKTIQTLKKIEYELQD